MTSEEWVFAAASAVLPLAFFRGVSSFDRRILRHPAVVGAGLLFLLSLIVRAVFAQPTLIHADLAAPELVDCILQFPRACANRGASYGQYGFWLVGALSRFLGRDLNAVFLAMQIIGALNIAMLAVLAYRLSGSAYGALFAVAITATNPIFVRVAASEDMHNLGLLLGLIGFIAMDIFAVSRRASALVAVVLALGLMVHTRQTFHIFAPCVFLLGLARGGRALLKSSVYWGAGLIVLALLLQRVLASDSTNLTQQMVAILTEPVLVPSLLRHHALFDVSRFGPLPVLTIAAILWAFLAGGLSRAVAVVFAVNFVVTYPCGMPSPGVELAQRIATHSFGLIICAMGGAAFLERRIDPTRRVAVGLSLAFALIAMPPFFPGWRAVSAITPIHREYLAVEAAAASLPSEFTQVVLPKSGSTSFGGSRYAGLLERMEKKVSTVPVSEIEGMSHPWIFLENIECWAYSFYELTGTARDVAEPPDFQYRWDRVIFGRQPSPLRPPSNIRPECELFLRGSIPIGPRHVITGVEDDPPFLFYADRSVPVQFHELREKPAD